MDCQFDEGDQLVSPNHWYLACYPWWPQPKVKSSAYQTGLGLSGHQCWSQLWNENHDRHWPCAMDQSFSALSHWNSGCDCDLQVEVCSGALNPVAVCILSQPKHKSRLHLSVNGHIGTASASIWKSIHIAVSSEGDLQTRNTLGNEPHCENKLLQQQMYTGQYKTPTYVCTYILTCMRCGQQCILLHIHMYTFSITHCTVLSHRTQFSML